MEIPVPTQCDGFCNDGSTGIRGIITATASPQVCIGSINGSHKGGIADHIDAGAGSHAVDLAILCVAIGVDAVLTVKVGAYWAASVVAYVDDHTGIRRNEESTSATREVDPSFGPY